MWGKIAVQVTKEDYKNYDYLICMDANNLRNLARIIGKDKDHKVSLLLDDIDRPGSSIADPWYSRRFDVTYSDIERSCEINVAAPLFCYAYVLSKNFN